MVDDYLGSTYAGRTVGIGSFYSSRQGRSTQIFNLKTSSAQIGSKALNWRYLGIVRTGPMCVLILLPCKPLGDDRTRPRVRD